MNNVKRREIQVQFNDQNSSEVNDWSNCKLIFHLYSMQSTQRAFCHSLFQNSSEFELKTINAFQCQTKVVEQWANLSLRLLNNDVDLITETTIIR